MRIMVSKPRGISVGKGTKLASHEAKLNLATKINPQTYTRAKSIEKELQI